MSSRRSLSTVELLEWKRHLGDGSYGVVELYKARMYGVNTRTTKSKEFDVVVKRPLRNFGTFMQEFERHADIYSKMRGKACQRYIPEPFNIRGSTRIRQPMYAMELVKGETFYDFFDTQKITPPMVKEVQTALRCLHKIGCVHNDAHPDNVLADMRDPAKPKVKLIDFGMTSCGFPKFSGSATDSKAHARWLKRAHRQIMSRQNAYGLPVKPNAMWFTTTNRNGATRRSCPHSNYLKCSWNPRQNRTGYDFHVNTGKILRNTHGASIASRSRSFASRTTAAGSKESLRSR